MSKWVAAALVFVCSGAVLMLEILAGRLLAPYVGISLETYTTIIGTVLAGIAVGAWLGGKLADRIDPRRLLGPTVLVGGVLALFIVPIIRAVGDQSGEGGRNATLFLTFTAFFLPAVVLSSVTPMVVKLQLHDLHRTGGVVGRLSGISTAGALVGTFVTGYLLTATTPTRTTIAVLGATLIFIGVLLGLWFSRRGGAVLVVLAVLCAVAATTAAGAREPCQVESAYYCIRIERDLAPSGRILWLDNLIHSYVDLNNPAYLEYDYAKSLGDAIAAAFPGHPPLDALHIGGGGFSLPRHLDLTYPGSKNLVLEIDPTILKVGREQLGLRTSERLQVRIGDARTGIRARPDDSADVVVGDAFGSLSVPWHLTTREFARDVDRVLRPQGVYVVNVIDYTPYRFARAELATLRQQFDWVAAIGPRSRFDLYFGGNVVLVASDRRVGRSSLDRLVAQHLDVVVEDAALDEFIGDAPVIRDDYAPVDQWLHDDTN